METLKETSRNSEHNSKPKPLNRNLYVGCTSQKQTGKRDHSAFPVYATELYKKPYEWPWNQYGKPILANAPIDSGQTGALMTPYHTSVRDWLAIPPARTNG